MRCCQWCGEPMDENAYGIQKYHVGRCAGSAQSFHSYLRNCGNRFKAGDFSTHERVYRRCLLRLQDIPAHKPYVLALGIPEWDCLAEMVTAMEECEIPSTTQNGPRLRELAAIADTLLSMPAETVYKEIPEETRSMIKDYLVMPLRYWYSHPEETIGGK